MTKTLSPEKTEACFRSLDKKVMSRFETFYHAVNSRSEYLAGYRSSYEAPDKALGLEVEYFHPTITYDDRMRYICENLVLNDKISDFNRVCNVIISHFYGARGIHGVITGETDPKNAWIDFERLAREQLVKADRPGDYTAWIRERCLKQKAAKKPFWGTTEIHSSLQGASGRFVLKRYGSNEKNPANLTEWIASWINTGTVEKILNARGMEELYLVFLSQDGVGPYYAYHGASSGSCNPSIKAYHDERFCEPGPGARETAKQMFPGLSEKEVTLAERVVFIRENQESLISLPVIHESRHNITVNGVSIFPEAQDALKTYGTEVCMCQFSVYERLCQNPHLISKRKVARDDGSTSEKNGPLDKFF